METGLQDRVVLVTGASGGIGAETVRAFLEEGARVISHYHANRDGAAQAIKDNEDRGVVLGADLTKEAEVARLFAEAVKTLGPIDVLVANAGGGPEEDVPVHETTLEQWRQIIDLNLTSAFLCVREFFRGIVAHKLTEPAAVLVGSTAALIGEAGHADYSAAKAGLTFGFAMSLKNEICRLAPRGRVNVVCPGWTITPAVKETMGDPEQLRRVLQTIPLRKIAQPRDVANAVVYLASSRLAGHVTGQILTVGGGIEGRVLYRPEEIDVGKAV